MENEIRAYFSTRDGAGYDGQLLRYCATQLCRAGVVDMPSLCRLVGEGSHMLLGLRNIGLKSLTLIRAVCIDFLQEESRAYQQEI